MFSNDQFMERAEDFFGLREQKGAIEEVREIIQQDEANAVTVQGLGEIKTTVEDEDILRQMRELVNEMLIYANSRNTPEHNRIIAEKVLLLEGHALEEAAKEAGVSPAMAGYVIRALQSHLRE